jgi:hypothetical protein
MLFEKKFLSLGIAALGEFSINISVGRTLLIYDLSPPLGPLSGTVCERYEAVCPEL